MNFMTRKISFSFPGAAAASRVYVDALSRLARQAQLGTWGGSKDVGKWKSLARSAIELCKATTYAHTYRVCLGLYRNYLDVPYPFEFSDAKSIFIIMLFYFYISLPETFACTRREVFKQMKRSTIFLIEQV